MGLARYVAHQAYYSLIGREYEWELMPLGIDQGVGAMVWSPLGWGRLDRQNPPGSAAAGRTAACNPNATADAGPPVAEEYVYGVVDALDAVAAEVGKDCPAGCFELAASASQLSASVIIGARNEEQLRQNLGAVGWNLTRGASRASGQSECRHAHLPLLASGRLQPATHSRLPKRIIVHERFCLTACFHASGREQL